MQKNEEFKTHIMAVRMTDTDYARLKRVCHRDELRPSVFAYESILKAIDGLMRNQDKNGFQCMQSL